MQVLLSLFSIFRCKCYCLPFLDAIFIIIVFNFLMLFLLLSICRNYFCCCFLFACYCTRAIQSAFAGPFPDSVIHSLDIQYGQVQSRELISYIKLPPISFWMCLSMKNWWNWLIIILYADTAHFTDDPLKRYKITLTLGEAILRHNGCFLHIV